MSRKHVTYKASSLPVLPSHEPASILPVGRMRPPWLGIDRFDPGSLSFAHVSTAKLCAVLAFLIVSASLFASVPL
jgi:hypothetical protein